MPICWKRLATWSQTSRLARLSSRCCNYLRWIHRPIRILLAPQARTKRAPSPQKLVRQLTRSQKRGTRTQEIEGLRAGGALGFGRAGVRNIRSELADDKFLEEIGGGGCANSDERVFER